MERDSKILVAGAKGMVGSAIVRRLEREGYTDICCAHRDEVNFTSQMQTNYFFKHNEFDYVFVAAAKVGGILANNNLRTEFILENLKININIFEACISNPDITIINLGSSCIYPLNAPNPIKESSFMEGKLEETNSPYAMAKLSAIEMGRSLNKQYGHRVINLMPTNLYGPNDNFDENSSHVIPGLIRRMYNAKLESDNVFSVWGDGTPLREFLYVDDLSNAIKFVIENDINEDLLNIGFGEEISIKELALKIKKIVNFAGDIEFDTTKPNGNPRKLLDTTLIRNYGWQPEFSLDKGLKLSFNWFKQNLS